MTRASQLRD
jgi:hypothetical protein